MAGPGVSLKTTGFILLLLFLLSTVFPFYWMFVASVREEGSIISNPGDLFPSEITFRNYVDCLKSGPFGRYIVNSVWVAVWVVLGNVILATMAGYAIARKRFMGKRIVLATVLGTLMIPKQITMIPVYILMSKLRMIDTYSALILPFLVDAFSVFFISQYVNSLPEELEEAARVDGASDYGIFFRVVFPLLKPALGIVAINSFLVNWNSFIYPLILTNSENMRTLPVGLALYSQGEHAVDWGHLMAGSTISALPVFLVFLAFQRQIIAGMIEGYGR
ncbi:MAG: carbohydrate ABC transporter permease [Candidatus Eisenbacteria bacterium]|nr:carbohydrate ABC transporter permease [Candidatus Eisenbacteria bacterium]